MIEKIFISSFIVFAIWYSMQEGEIFGGLGRWFEKVLPEVLHKPVFDCPVCMGFWYSLPLFVFLWGLGWLSILLSIAVVGLNAIITKLWPDE